MNRKSTLSQRPRKEKTDHAALTVLRAWNAALRVEPEM
jgi:hypothetical protein